MHVKVVYCKMKKLYAWQKKHENNVLVLFLQGCFQVYTFIKSNLHIIQLSGIEMKCMLPSKMINLHHEEGL